MAGEEERERSEDRKSTRLNSSHLRISYAVFCLKKKKSTDARQRQCGAESHGRGTRAARAVEHLATTTRPASLRCQNLSRAVFFFFFKRTGPPQNPPLSPPPPLSD